MPEPNVNLCAVWYCKVHDVYFDMLGERKHDECAGSPVTRYSLNPDEVIYYLNEAQKARKFVQQLRRFIDAGGMLAPDVIVVDRT